MEPDRPLGRTRAAELPLGNYEAAAWRWISETRLFEGSRQKQIELVASDLVVSAFFLYEQLGPAGTSILEWRWPYLQIEGEHPFVGEEPENRTPWGTLLREAVRLVRAG